MKKILALLLVLVLAVTAMASCDLLSNLGIGNGDLGLPGINKDDNNNEGPTVEDAKNYLFNIYKDSNASPKNDYDVVALVKVDGVTFNVTWTASIEAVSVKASTKDGFFTVDLPDKNDVAVDYVLTATIKDAAGNTAEVKLNKTLPVINNEGIVARPVEGTAYKFFMEQAKLDLTLYATNKDEQDHKYITMTLDPKAAADYYVEVVGEGYKIYTTADDGSKLYVHAKTTKKSDGKWSKYIGLADSTDCVFVYNETINALVVEIDQDGVKVKYAVGTYNAFETIGISEATFFTADNTGVDQFPACFMVSSFAETQAPDEKPVVNDPAANSTLTIAQAIELGNSKIKEQYTTGKYYVTGVITEVQSTTYGNMVISDGNGNTILVYGTYDATGANRYDAMAVQPVVGDTVTVYGIIGMYNAPQIKNGWITSHTPAGGETPDPGVDPQPKPQPELSVVDPVVGTAYKFGMVQGNLNDGKVYYLDGTMNGYYMNTTADASAAVDVYLEATEGGYYLYILKGEAKSYINFVSAEGTDGKTHINGKYETTGSSVFTYSTEKKTVVTLIDGEEYWLGTRNDKTYTTVGPVKVSYEGFYNQFYGEAVAHEHSYEAVVTAPTCTEAGYTTHTCACGDSYTDTPVDATGHNYENGACTGCGLEETHVHSYEATVTAPTCTEAGYTTHTCACGDSYTDTPVDATGHSYEAVVTAPTCTEAGYTTHTCACGDSYTDTPVDATGHTDATGDFKCDVCGATALPADGTALTVAEALVIAQLGGSSYTTQKYYISGVVTGLYNTTYGNFYIEDATGTICIYGLYSADGATRYDAMNYKPVNGDEITVYTVLGTYNSNAQGKSAWLDEVVAHEHNYESVVTEPTCLKDGFTTHTCSICGGSYTDSEVEKLGHTTENGTCERCGNEIGGAVSTDPITASKTMKELITSEGWTSSTTKQSFDLDDVVSVKIDGGNNTGKAYNGDHIRIYATDTPAGTMTITLAEGYELVSIKVTTQTGTYAFLCVDGTTTDICNQTVTVSGSSVVLNSVKNGSDGKQVRVTAIEVVYKAVG